jgi:hypothetical protein
MKKTLAKKQVPDREIRHLSIRIDQENQTKNYIKLASMK